MKTVYKVLSRDNKKLFSAVASGLLRTRYITGKVTKCRGNNLLLCFKREIDAFDFVKTNSVLEDMCVYKCECDEYEDVAYLLYDLDGVVMGDYDLFWDDRRFVSSKKRNMANHFCAPKGTVGCKWIRLIKRMRP